MLAFVLLVTPQSQIISLAVGIDDVNFNSLNVNRAHDKRRTRVGLLLGTTALFILLVLNGFCVEATPHEAIRKTAILSLSMVLLYSFAILLCEDLSIDYSCNCG